MNFNFGSTVSPTLNPTVFFKVKPSKSTHSLRSQLSTKTGEDLVKSMQLPSPCPDSNSMGKHVVSGVSMQFVQSVPGEKNK